MNLTTPADPPPEDIERGIAEIEQHLAAQAPAQPAPTSRELAVPAPAEDDDEDEDVEAAEHVIDIDIDLDGGETRRVRSLRAEVAEAHLLVGLQEDEAPLLVDSPRVRKRRRAAYEAAKLHELTHDPVALAYRDAKVRRAVTVMVMSAASIALAVSSIGVQSSVAKALDLPKHSVGWWAAFGVEPAMSLPLLATVGAQAYSAIRGVVVDRKSDAGRKLFRTEALLLGLTLVLNCWPAIKMDFDLLAFIVHSLGPVAAVTAVWVLPTLWQVLAALPVPLPERTGGGSVRPVRRASSRPSSATGRTPSSTADDQRRRRPAEGGSSAASRGRTADEHRAELRRLIAAGELPSRPSARAIQNALRCREELSRELRDELRDRGESR
ncbi:hypothetical protein [Nonomuraea roseoviolacea]|uniref:DUF2637 domain-containing protein n=1 Tax=Nonomuraea roseoviolacea subsp. carminata TaxID=160689 RepID=A0ABT1KB11_9ACTN|nr:hypothetical protein [Nonomuraea roseoviolacea]MCP2350586.1 hypothetical protein [Nonomuraea roseoviolacea subsp. carminata]